jgi:hypothetical protein
MDEILRFFRDNVQVFQSMGAIATAAAAVFSIIVALRAMKKTDLEIANLEKEGMQVAPTLPLSQSSHGGHWADSPRGRLALLILAAFVKAYLVLWLLRTVLDFIVAGRDEQGGVFPLAEAWWLIKNLTLLSATVVLLWPIVKALRRFTTILLNRQDDVVG